MPSSWAHDSPLTFYHQPAYACRTSRREVKLSVTVPIISAVHVLSSPTREAVDASDRCLGSLFTNISAFGTVKALI
jgi:hypothetical protein